MNLNDYRLNIILVTFALILFWAVLFSPNAYVSGVVIITDILGAILGYVYLVDNDNKWLCYGKVIESISR